MEIIDLLAAFAEPETIHTLSVSQKLYASLITTILGMGITFVSLIVLQIITTLFDKIAPTKKADTPQTPAVVAAEGASQKNTEQEQEEVVAAITTSLAVMLETSTTNIVVKNIRRIEDTSPTWSRAGINEQVQNTV